VVLPEIGRLMHFCCVNISLLTRSRAASSSISLGLEEDVLCSRRQDVGATGISNGQGPSHQRIHRHV